MRLNTYNIWVDLSKETPMPGIPLLLYSKKMLDKIEKDGNMFPVMGVIQVDGNRNRVETSVGNIYIPDLKVEEWWYIVIPPAPKYESEIINPNASGILVKS